MSEKGYLAATLGLILSAFLFRFMAPWVFISLFIISASLFLIGKNDGLIGLTLLLMIFLSIGSMRFASEMNLVKSFADKNIYTYKIQGIINSQPQFKNGKFEFFLKTESINDKPTTGFLWVRSKNPLKAFYGDRLAFTGNLMRPSQKGFAGYLLIKRVKDVCNLLKVKKVEKTFLSPIGGMRKKIESMFKRNDDTEALLLASFIGDTSNLSENTKSDFKTSGLAHLWSVSGLHVGILMIMVMFILRLAGFKPLVQLTVTTALLILYSLLAALSPPVVRSAVMGFVAIFSWYLGRKKDLFSILLLTFVVLILYDPLMIYDVGFQLSFASVFGILLIASKIEKLFWDWPSFLKSSVAVSLSAQIVTTPLLVYQFGSAPVYSVVANIFAIPLVMPMMALMAGYILLFWMPGAYILKILAKIPAKAILGIAAYVSKLPLSRLSFENPILIFSLVIVGAAAAFLVKKHKISLATSLIVITVVISTGFAVQTSNKPPGNFSIQFFDVGQGDSSLITEAGNSILIDGGPDYDTVADKLRAQGFNSIDIVILTHPNADHSTGLLKVLKNFKVGLFVNSGFNQPSYIYKEILTEIKNHRIKYMEPKAGKILKLGNFKIRFFNPPEELLRGTKADDNNNSVVNKIESNGVSAIFTGDIQDETEKILVENYKPYLKADILKVPHHGSAYSSTTEFLDAVKPKYSVIQSGLGNSYGHPAPSALFRLQKAGSKIYRNDLDGNVTVSVEENGIVVKEEK